jgi:hypothetical protein
MSSEFPYVTILAEFAQIIGERQGDTHVYRREGAYEEIGSWFELLTDLIGPTISPGGVGMFCPVSRASVHERVKRGKLSMFLFYVTHRKTTIFGKNKTVRESPFAYIPVSECKAWRKEIEARAQEQGYITRKELEGSKPDWEGEFMKWDSRWQKHLDKPTQPRDRELKVMLTADELTHFERVADSLKFPSAGSFATYVLAPMVHGGFSGISFIQSARRVTSLIEEHGVGEFPLPKVLEFLRKKGK